MTFRETLITVAVWVLAPIVVAGFVIFALLWVVGWLVS